MKTITVLLLGAGRRTSFAEYLRATIEAMGYKSRLMSYEGEQHVPVAEFAEIIVGARFSAPSALEQISMQIEKNNVDIVIPLHDKAIPLATQLKTRAFVPVSDLKTVSIFSSKKRTGQFLRENQLACPPVAKSVPAIAKPDFGSASLGIKIFRDQKEFEAFVESEDSVNFEVQELIAGPEFSVDCYVALNSDFRLFAPRERLEVIGGEVTRSRTVNIPQLVTETERIVDTAGLCGAFTVQFIRENTTGDLFAMEVNPRFGGGLPTTILAGVPWMRILLRDALGLAQERIEYDTNYLVVRSLRAYGFSLGG